MIDLRQLLGDRAPEASDSAESLTALAEWMEHVETRAEARDGENVGSTRWACRGSQGRLWIEWDWFEMQPEVLAIEDAAGIRSNLPMLNPRGEPLTPSKRNIALMTLVYLLPWRDFPLAALYPNRKGGAGLEESPPPNCH